MTTTIEVKSDIYKLIDSVNDIDILYAIKILLQKQQSNSVESDFWDEIPDYVKERINLSIKQADSGKLHAHQEVMQRIRKKYQSNGN